MSIDLNRAVVVLQETLFKQIPWGHWYNYERCCHVLSNSHAHCHHHRKEDASVHTDGRGGGVIHSFVRYFCSGNSGEQQFILDAQQRWRQQLGQRGGWWWVCRCLFLDMFKFSFSSVKDSVSIPIYLHPVSYQSCVLLYDVYVFVFGCFWSRNFLAFSCHRYSCN